MAKQLLYVSGNTEGKKIADFVASDFVIGGVDYSKSIVFAAETGEIWNRGKAFGLSADSKTALETVIAKVGDEATEGSIAYDVDQLKTLVYANEDEVINKLQEIITWFNSLPEDSQVATDLIADVAANKAAIGEKGTKEVSHEATAEEAAAFNEAHAEEIAAGTVTEMHEGDKVVDVEASEATGLYKTIDEAVAAAAGDASEDLQELEDLVGELPEDAESETVVDYVSEVVNSTVGAWSTEEAEATGLRGEIEEKISSAIEAADKVIVVAEDSVDYLGVAEDDDHTISAKVSTLGEVGLVQGEDGKWAAGTATEATGLATAADVATEIVNDELVIAAALNDLNDRLGAIESDTDLADRVAALEDWTTNDWEEL